MRSERPRVVRYLEPREERSDDPTRARERLLIVRQAMLEHGPDVVVTIHEGSPPPDAVAAELDALLRLEGSA